MFKFPHIPASQKPRTREFSEAMREGAVLHFTCFIDAFQKRIAAAEKYPALKFFRTSLARRSLLYSIMSAYWKGEKLNIVNECAVKGMDYSNTMKTIKEARQAGFIDKEFTPSAALEQEFRMGVKDALEDPTLVHLARSLIGSNMMMQQTLHYETLKMDSGK